MASILNAKTVDTVPPGAPSCRPSRIPVRTGYSSGSASDDSDHSSKSESKSRTGGKSRLPLPVTSPVKKLANSSKPAQTSGSQSYPEKNSVNGVEEKVVPATGNAEIKNEDNDTAAEPIKKMPARLKSLKIKKTSSVNQARCDPLSRSVIPGINKKQVPATPSSDALAFMQQGRLRPARKFQPKKASVTDDSSEEEHQRPSGGIGRRTSYRNIHMHSPDEQKPKPAKKVSTVGLKDPKNTSAPSSKRYERPSSSSRNGTKNTTTSKAKKGAKSDRKNKESDVSESDDSLGLKPRKISFNYEAESDDPVSTVSEASCAPMEAKSKNEDERERLMNTLGYDEAYDVVPTDSEASCAPMEAKSKNEDEIERLMNTLGYDEAYDVVPTDSEASCAPMEAKSHDTNNNEPFMADIQWLKARNIEFEDCSDFSTTDSISEKAPQKDQIQVEKLAQPSVPDIQTEDHKDDQAAEKENEEDIFSDSFWDIKPNKPEQSKDQPETGPCEESVKNDKRVDKDSTDEGSFVEELEELLSAAEAEIEASNTPKHQHIAADNIMPAPVPNLCVDGIITASNETNNTNGQQSGSQHHEPSGEGGSNRMEVAGGSGRAQGSSVGGSGDGDDPNDPKKPKPSKEPDDKKDEDDKKDKERVAAEAIAKQRMGNTDGEGFLLEVKATQTEEEGNVAALYKAIRSKNNEIDMMKKLVENCRHDYEELQGNFDKYTKDFKEVDANRTKISTLTHENKFLKQENSLLKSELSQSKTEASQAQEERKEVKIKLSKMEVDFDFLVTEKKELLTKLKLYEGNTPPQQVDPQKADHKQEAKKTPVKHQPGKSSSLQDIEAMKAEEEMELKNKSHHGEKASKASEEIEQLKKTLTAFQEKLLQDVIQIKQMKSKIESTEAERDRLETDLRKTEEKLDETITYKDREISNLMKDNDKKERKNEELTREIKDVLKGNDSLRNTLQTWCQKYNQKDDTEKELKKSIDDLETENENLLKELSEQRLKLLDARREKIEDEDIPIAELESLQIALKSKIETMSDVINNVEEITTNDPDFGAHPFSSDLECALQLLYDIYELLKTKGKAFMKIIGCPCSCNGQTPGPSTEEEGVVKRNEEMAGEEHGTLGEEDQERPEIDSRLEEQESLMDDLRERIKILTQENHKLEKKVKKRKVKFSEDTLGGESDEVFQLQKEMKEKELQIAEMEEEMIRVRAENDMLADYVKDVIDKADHDVESLTSQNEMQTNHIKRLQNDCANQRIIAKNLQGELSECIQKNVTLSKKLKDVDEERQELQEKLKAVKDSESTRRQTEIHLNHIQKLQEDCEKQRLISKNLRDELAEFKKKNATLDAIGNGNSGQEQDLQQNLAVKGNETEAIQKLQEDFEEQRLTAKKLSDELSKLKGTNESLDKKLKEVELEKEMVEEKLETVKDAESFRRQTDIHLNHIQRLQRDSEQQRLCVKKLKGQVFELENNNTTLDTKLKDIEAEKYALEQKLKALTQEIQKDTVIKEAGTAREGGWITGTPSTAGEREEEIKELQEFNEKLGEKIDMYEAFFQQVKEDKVKTMKDFETSRQNALTLKKKSDEKIEELEKILADKNGLETKLQDKVKFLEKRTSDLEAEKADHESQLKAMVESLQTHNELEKSKEEWKQLELELRNSMMTLATEKSEAQKELEEQKSVATKASESLAVRMKELDKCQQERQDLTEELECLKSTNSKLKEEMAKKLIKTGRDVDQRLSELELLKHSPSEVIHELEKQLKDRRDSEIELMERAATLNEQIVQLEAEKVEADGKIRALMESIEDKEIKAKHKTLDEENELNEKLSNMEAKMSELEKEKQKAEQDIVLARKESEMKLATLEKRLEDQRDSETMFQEKIQSLELRISQLTAEKEERDKSIKTLMEAMNANKNLEDQLKNKGELEPKLSNKVEELRLKFSRIKSTKKKLERQLLKQRSEIATLSSKPKHHSKEYQDQMDELNERLRRLSESESQARLVIEKSDNKIKALEKQLLSKGQSEEEQREMMASLEEKIARLETERSQHCKNISSIIRKLKTKEDLADAIAARDEAEHEYNIKIDEMEIIVNKLRTENRKEDCNEELKERYKMEYEESRSNVRASTEKLNRCNERVKELQAFILEADEDLHSQDTQEITLHENIERLKERLKALDTVDLFETLQSLKERITQLEAEKADGKKIITAMLKSIEDKETSQMQQMNMTEVIKKFRDEKKLLEDELQDSKKLRAAKESESELLKSQTDKKISTLQQSLNERLETMSEKLVQLESSKEETNKTIQTMLESLQWKDNLEQCLDEKEIIEKELKRRMQELKLENDEALVEAKKYRVQCRDMHKMKEQITTLKEQLLQMEYSKEKAIESLEKLQQQKDEQLWQMDADKDRALENANEMHEQKVKQIKSDKHQAMEKMKRLLQQKEEQLLQMNADKDRALKNANELHEQKVQQIKSDKHQAMEKMKRLLQQKEEQLLQMDADKDRALKNANELHDQKVQQIKSDKHQAMEKMKRLLQQKEEQLLQMDADKDRALKNANELHEQKIQQMESEKLKAIEKMKRLLQQKEEHIELVKKTLKDEVLKLKLEKKDLEIEKKQSEIETRNAFELIKKQSDDFNESLNERNESSERMMAEIQNLKESLSTLTKERDELDDKAKKYAKLTEECKKEVERTAQREVELLQKLSGAQTVNEELRVQILRFDEELAKSRLEKTESINIYKEKIKQLYETLQVQSDQERDLRHTNDWLKKETKSLEEDKENVIQEKSVIIESLNMELEMQSTREIELKGQLGIFQEENDKLRRELDDQAKREVEIREEKTQEIQKIRSENADTSETLKAKISEMNRELTRYIAKENEMRCKIESTRVEKEKLLNEVDELNNEISSSTKASRELINKLRKSEKELLEKVDELKLTVRTLEGEKRRVSMEYKDYQSDILNITQTSRDANKRMQEDIKVLQQDNNNLHAQLREMKLNESCLFKEKQAMVQQNQENAEKITQIKNKIQKQKTEISRLMDRERELKDEIIDLKSKISAAENQKVQDKAEKMSRESSLILKVKLANSKIDDLQAYIKNRYRKENNFLDEIEQLKNQICELNQTLEDEQLDKTEISRRHSLTKCQLVELENSIKRKDLEIQQLSSCSEELRAQVLCLQQEKHQISTSLQDCRSFLSQSNAKVHTLEGNFTHQLTNLRDEVRTNSIMLGNRLDLIRSDNSRGHPR